MTGKDGGATTYALAGKQSDDARDLPWAFGNGIWDLYGVGRVTDFGNDAGVPIAADYNGDGRDELWFVENGKWHVYGIGIITDSFGADLCTHADFLP